MDTSSGPHPSDRTLNSYGLGKLDDVSAQAVNKHLEQCARCRKRAAEASPDTFLERVREAQVHAGVSTSAKSAPGVQREKGTKVLAPPPAATLPPGLADHAEYEIKGELGRGGMGVVYLAHNTMMDRDEVLKVMGKHIMERPGVLDRFLREIRAVAKLRHPNIVTAYHATMLGESIVFAMEYVDGWDLSQIVKSQGHLPVALACNFVYQAALGLQHAHEEGLVHRDIKPGNLMLSRKGKKPTIKVLDFGLAKATREEKVEGELTSEGQALGTPDFMAPEQIMDAMSADIRADIYSLGGTLYYLLSGRAPFQANSLYDMYQAHISQDASPLNLVRPEVPAELAALVAKMMAKDPARRFQTPGEVAKALMPFFKKASVGFETRLPTISQDDQSMVNQLSVESASTSTKQAVGETRPDVRSGKPKESTSSSSEGKPFSEFLEIETASHPTVPAIAATGRRPWSLWPMCAAAVGIAAIAFAVSGYITYNNEYVAGDPRTRENSTSTTGDAARSPAVAPTDNKPAPATEPSLPSADVERSAFVSLFNGEDLTGWKTHPSQKGNWQVEDGVLVGSGANMSCLYTDRNDFKDFHLRLEARFNKDCNASIFFCSTYGPVLPQDAPRRPEGYEVPINSTHKLLAGGILTAPEDVEWSIWGNPSVPPDRWFSLDVIADGDIFTVSLNGAQSVYYIEKNRLFSSGHFALEQSSRQSVIEFRKIEIKEFKSTDKKDPRELARLVGHSGRVTSVRFSPDGKRLLSCGGYHARLYNKDKGTNEYLKGEDDTVRMWDAKSGQNLFTSPAQSWEIRAVAFSTDGRYAASWSGSGDRTDTQDLFVWDLASGQRTHQLPRSDKNDFGVPRAVAFSSDNRRVFAVFASPSVHAWDLETDKERPVVKLKTMDSLIASATFTSDRKRLITGSQNGPVELWDIESGERLKAFEGHAGQTGAVDRSADDRVFFSGAADRTIRLWDAATTKQLRALTFPNDGLRCGAISPDGHRILTGGNFGTIWLIDLDTGAEICRLGGHRSGVNTVAFSPDGQRASSGSDDRTVRIWKLP